MKKSTKQAFTDLINQRGIHQQLGVSDSTVRDWRKKIRDGTGGITIDKMEELLQRAGFKKIQETLWSS